VTSRTIMITMTLVLSQRKKIIQERLMQLLIK